MPSSWPVAFSMIGPSGPAGASGVGTSLTENFMVAAGVNTNKLAYSYNGTLWYPSASGNTVFTVVCITVAWNGSLWVAGGDGINTLAYSADGINWTGLGDTIFTSCSSVAWNGSSWLASGSGTGTTNKLAVSFDGINWTSSTADTSYSLLAWNGSLWVGASGALQYSSDGITWSSSTSGTSVFNDAANSVAWNGSVWLAGGSGTTHKLARSDDGIVWTGLATTVFTVSCRSVAWNGSLWVAGGEGANRLAYSIDGNTWTPSTSGNGIFIDACITVAWNGSVWIAGGLGPTNTLAYSVNGITWTPLGNTIFDLGSSTVASRRPLPYVGYSYAKSIAGSGQMVYSGTTLANITGVSGDYFINTSSGILYKYRIISAGLATDVSTFAGNGEYGQTNSSLLNSTFWNIINIAIDSNNNKYVIEINDANTSRNIRKIDSFGVVSTFVANLQLNYGAITTDILGNIYISAYYSGAWNILKITPAASICVLFPDPSDGAWDLKFDSAGNIYCINPWAEGKLYKVTPSGTVSTFASGFFQITGGAFDSNGNLYVISQPGGTVQKITPSGTVSLFASIVSSGGTSRGAFDSDNNLYVTNTFHNVINKITPNGDITVFAGVLDTPGFLDGPKLSAKFNWPIGIALDSYGSMFITDTNLRIRTISSAPGGPGWQYIYNLNGSSASGSYPYSPATPANWTNPVPSSFGAAIDRLAAAVAGLMPSGTLP
jgi:hypothetical protein